MLGFFSKFFNWVVKELGENQLKKEIRIHSSRFTLFADDDDYDQLDYYLTTMSDAIDQCDRRILTQFVTVNPLLRQYN